MKKKIIALLFALVFALSALALPASAASPYQTYTYSINGTPLYSPDAYTPIKVMDSDTMGLEVVMKNPTDLVIDGQLNMYVADRDNNRILVNDRYGKNKFIIETFINEDGVPDELTHPQGLFVTEDTIYVCDTDAARIVTFDLEGNFLSVIPAPESSLFDEGSIYSPVAIAVDKYDRLFVVSRDTYQGIIVMTSDGAFTGFIGAQAVSLTFWETLIRRFQTEEQREQSVLNVSVSYNNIAVTEEGFVYATTSYIDEADVQSFIKSKSSSGKYSPVKLLNAKGDEIMKRNGFWPPAGEVDMTRASSADKITGPSTVVDVAVGPEKTWSIVDSKRNKIFTYDFNGNLLYAFGDTGQQIGNLMSVTSIVYQDDTMLVLDKSNCTITVYERTEYGDILIDAIKNQNAQLYDSAVDDWTEILKRNSNFDAAYVGIGNALYRDGAFEESLAYYRSAYDTTNYSKAYQEIRKEWISDWIILLPIVVVVVIVLWVLLMRYANKVNKKAAVTAGKRTFKEELLYCFHTMFHPFDGYWDLKHEKRGSIRASLVYILITILAFYYQNIGTGYISNPRETYSSFVAQITGVLLPLLLFVVGNWCLTTLFDGEGSMKDIFIATSYSLVPLPVFIIVSTMLSNVALKSEIDMISMLITIAFIWVGLLLFFGVMTVHDYSLGKNVLTIIGTLAAMVFIMFIALLFTTLLSKVVGLISNIITEVSYRV
ncbi:MAG: YIP1 family protein [Clostridia bacterium]|nr:YIP1 family protein [Clostridia bacterium]